RRPDHLPPGDRAHPVERGEDLPRRAGGAMTELAAILHALADDSWRARKDAVAATVAYPDRGAVLPALVALLDVDAPLPARSAAVEAVASIGAAAVPALVAELAAKRGPGRKFAIDALASMDAAAAAAAVPALIDCLDDADDNVRAAAAETLGRGA